VDEPEAGRVAVEPGGDDRQLVDDVAGERTVDGDLVAVIGF
jgi:hypothetical protein